MWFIINAILRTEWHKKRIKHDIKNVKSSNKSHKSDSQRGLYIYTLYSYRLMVSNAELLYIGHLFGIFTTSIRKDKLSTNLWPLSKILSLYLLLLNCRYLRYWRAIILVYSCRPWCPPYCKQYCTVCHSGNSDHVITRTYQN